MNLLFYFFKFGISFLLVNQLLIFLKKNYPDDYNNYVISISYNIIFIYSKVQLITMKVSKYLKSYMVYLKNKYPELPKLFLTFGETNDYVEFIKDGEVFLKTNVDNINKINTKIYNFDFILLTRIYEGNIKNKIIYYYLPEDNDFSSYLPLIENSNLHFILVELTIQDYTIVLHFKNHLYNYLMMGNIFDFSFLIYFLKTHYNNEYKKLDICNLSEKDLKMRIMDGNVNNYEFDMSNKIKINKNDFTLIKNQAEEEKEVVREFVMDPIDNFLPTNLMDSLNSKISSSFDFNNMDVKTISNKNIAEPKIRNPSETEYECL